MPPTLRIRFGILIYASRLIFPRHHPCLFPLYMLILYNQIRKWKRIYRVVSLPAPIMAKFLESHPSKDAWDDSNNTLIVNNRCLNDYRLRGGFVKLIDSRQIILRVAYAIGADLKDDVLYVSDCLSHNLGQIGHLKLKPVTSGDLNFASEVNLSLISNSYDVGNTLNDVLLRNYFNSPKIVRENDFISIDLMKYAPDFYYTTTKVLGLENVNFKCSRVQGSKNGSSNALCVVGETTLKQNANVQSFLAPKSRRARENCTDYEGCAISLCPYGLESALDELEKAVRPFLRKGKVRLKPMFLLQGPKGSGKSQLVMSLASKLGLNLYELTSLELTGSVYAQTETKVRNAFMKAKLSAPCVMNIINFENFGKNAEGEHDQRIMDFFRTELDSVFASNSFPLILICSSNSKTVPPELCRIFLQTFDLTAPDERARLEILRWVIESYNLETEPGLLEQMSRKTHGFLFEDLKALVSYSLKNSKFSSNLAETDFESALDLMQSKYSQSLGAPKVPKVQWSDVGGLSEVKHEIVRTINLPLKHPELLKETGLKRSGILLYGPPGTGKTLIAKAVATECNLCFLSVKGPELLNMYVGQSEQNIREVFERAREASPCIIFFDELDSLAPNRGVSGDSGGVMDRIVSQLLAEMDGLNQSATIFIIGATNRPDLIDPALLRPGRFDKLLYVGPCTDFESKLSVLQALTRKFVLEDDVNLKAIVKNCPKSSTGADLYGMCSGAWMCAVRRTIRRVEEGQTGLTHKDVKVGMADFVEILRDLKPSVTAEDLAYFDDLQKQLGVVK